MNESEMTDEEFDMGGTPRWRAGHVEIIPPRPRAPRTRYPVRNRNGTVRDYRQAQKFSELPLGVQMMTVYCLPLILLAAMVVVTVLYCVGHDLIFGVPQPSY